MEAVSQKEDALRDDSFDSDTAAHNGGRIKADSTGFNGRIKEGGAWKNVSASDPANDFRQGATFVGVTTNAQLKAQQAAVISLEPSADPNSDWDSPGEEMPTGFGDFTFCKNYIYCADWMATFSDVGVGEDYATAPDEQWVDASYSWARVMTSTGSTKWQGRLDAAGCTPVIFTCGGSYYFDQTTDLAEGQKTFSIITGQYGSGSIYLHTAFSVSGIGTTTTTVNIQPQVVGPDVNAAAVVSRTLASPDNGLAEGHINVYSARRCMEDSTNAWDTCAYENNVYIGEPNPTGAADSDYKFIITHEIGHTAQRNSMGVPMPWIPVAGAPEWYHDPYFGDVLDNAPTYCRCGYIDPEAEYTNADHCLQSREFIATAEREGYAQFFAAKVWNNPAQTDCYWAYYKKSLVWLPGIAYVPQLPPSPRTCVTPQRWMESQCPSGMADRGVEWDWQIFYYNVNTRTANKSSMTDLHNIYKASSACNGSCEDKDVRWESFRGSAQNYYASNSYKYQHILTQADLNGVDH